MNVNDLTRHGFHPGWTSGFLFLHSHHTLPTEGSLVGNSGAICPRNHSLGFGLGHGTSGFTLGSGETRNMDKHRGLSRRCSRSRSTCLAGRCPPFFRVKLGGFHSDGTRRQCHYHLGHSHPSLWCSAPSWEVTCAPANGPPVILLVLLWHRPWGSPGRNPGVGFHFLLCAKSLQSCLTLCDPMDCSPPGSSAHRILQARILKCVDLPSSRGSSQPRNWTHVSYICHSDRQAV